MATDDGRSVTIDTATYRALTLGLAATIHKSQGVTVSKCRLNADALLWPSSSFHHGIKPLGLTPHLEVHMKYKVQGSVIWENECAAI